MVKGTNIIYNISTELTENSKMNNYPSDIAP